MAKLLMISANLMDDPYPVYPLGANLVSSAVKNSGHEVIFIDLLVDGESFLFDSLKEFEPDYVAVSLRNVDNVNFSEPHSFIFQYKSIIEKIKAFTRAPIILGGTAYTIFPDKFIEFLGADYGIIGPGEKSLPALIKRLLENDPPGHPVIQGEPDLSGNNDYFLDREKRLSEFYIRQGGMLNIYTKRGCPHHCLYCSYPNLEGNEYIFRHPGSVADEIEYLILNRSADFIFFTDSVFNDKDNQYLSVIEEMAKRNIRVPWTCYMRPSKFKRDEVELMKRTGLHSVEWGTDCSSDRTLSGMQKDFNWEDVRTANNLFAEQEIPGSHFIIFGGPGENSSTVREGIKNLSELEYSVIFGGIGLRVFPNTGIFYLAKKEGLVKGDDDLFRQEIYYHSPEVDIEWLNNFLLETFKERRRWVYPWSNQAYRNRFMHNSGIRGPLWDLLLKGKDK